MNASHRQLKLRSRFSFLFYTAPRGEFDFICELFGLIGQSVGRGKECVFQSMKQTDNLGKLAHMLKNSAIVHEQHLI